MKNIEAILNKKYHKKIEKLSIYRDKLKQMQITFKEYGIACVVKDEWSFYQLETIYEGILNKKAFEDTFLTTYVDMHDFWADLDYQERKHQMNVDIDQMRKELKSFPYAGEDMYIPMFDVRMNRLYTKEIVLLELKQYKRFINSFQDVIIENAYGVLPYMYNFSSCLYICGDDHYFALYNPDVNRLYFIENFHCTHTLNFDSMRSARSSFEEIKKIAECFMKNDEAGCTRAIMESELIVDSMKKKLEKYLKKITKKTEV